VTWCPATSSVCVWATSYRGCAPAGRRSSRSRSVGVDGRILARHRQPAARCFRVRFSVRRDRRYVYATGTNTYFGKDPPNWCRKLIPSAISRRAVLKIGDYLCPRGGAGRRDSRRRTNPRDKVLTTLEFASCFWWLRFRWHAHRAVGDHGVGARLLAKKEAIVTRLSAIEELAWGDVLCSDKNRHTYAKQTDTGRSVHGGRCSRQVILWAALASRAEDKDTIDLAVIGA